MDKIRLHEFCVLHLKELIVPTTYFRIELANESVIEGLLHIGYHTELDNGLFLFYEKTFRSFSDKYNTIDCVEIKKVDLLRIVPKEVNSSSVIVLDSIS